MKKFIKLTLLLFIVSLSPLFASEIEDYKIIENQNVQIFSDETSNFLSLSNSIPNNFVEYSVSEDKPELNTEQNKSKTEAKEENNNYPFFVDGFFGPSMRIARKNTIALGGHASVDFHFLKEFSLGIYAHGEYFFSPLGSSSGLLGGLEIELDGGININFPIFQRGNFMMKLGCDIGYYMQWLQYESTISTSRHLVYNGMMLRPTFQLQFTKLWGMPIGIAFYYQITTVIQYKDYDGFGIYLML